MAGTEDRITGTGDRIAGTEDRRMTCGVAWKNRKTTYY